MSSLSEIRREERADGSQEHGGAGGQRGGRGQRDLTHNTSMISPEHSAAVNVVTDIQPNVLDSRPK